MWGSITPTHFLKSRGSVIRNNFLEYRTKQSKKEGKDQESDFFLDEMFFYTLFATYKGKHILHRHISCSCSNTIYSKIIKKNHKKSHCF